MKKWDSSELLIAREMIISGHTYAEIAKALYRSGKSVRLKLNKVGLFYGEFHPKITLTCAQCGVNLCRGQYRFCSHSCSAIYNNKSRAINTVCKLCGRRLKSSHSSFCSNTCNYRYKALVNFKLIEVGDFGAGMSCAAIGDWIKRYLIHVHGNRCMKCGWGEVSSFSGKVPVELEHIDGNSENNDLSNVLLLCPNCHSLTPTFRALNRGNGRHNRRERYRNGKSF